jgi:hypothetical protein
MAAGAPDPGAAGAPPSWNAALGEMGNAPALSVFKGEDLVPMPKSLAKAYIDTKAMVGADKIAKPQDTWKPEQWEQFYSELGRPATPKDYQLSDVSEVLGKVKGPDGSPIEIDDGFRDYMLGIAHREGLTNRQFDGFYKAFVERQINDMQAFQQSDQQALEQWTAEQKTRLGTAYDATMDLAGRALSAAGAPEGSELFGKLKELTFSDGTPLLRHPAFLDVFGALGKKLSEGNLLPGEKQVTYGRTKEDLEREIVQFRAQHGAKMVGEGPEARMLQKEYQVLSDQLAKIMGVNPT